MMRTGRHIYYTVNEDKRSTDYNGFITKNNIFYNFDNSKPTSPKRHKKQKSESKECVNETKIEKKPCSDADVFNILSNQIEYYRKNKKNYQNVSEKKEETKQDVPGAAPKKVVNPHHQSNQSLSEQDINYVPNTFIQDNRGVCFFSPTTKRQSSSANVTPQTNSLKLLHRDSLSLLSSRNDSVTPPIPELEGSKSYCCVIL